MTEAVLERRRTGWDVVLGVLLVIGGFFILGHIVLATVVSVILLAWVALLSGALAVLAALFRIGKGGFWSTALSGGLLVVLGLVLLRNPAAGALTLTLVAGSMFLAIGITRLIAAVQNDAYRWVLLVGGLVSTLLGLLVLFNLFEATLTLLGVLMGVQTLVDGVSLLLVGRPRMTQVPVGTTRGG